MHWERRKIEIMFLENIINENSLRLRCFTPSMAILQQKEEVNKRCRCYNWNQIVLNFVQVVEIFDFSSFRMFSSKSHEELIEFLHLVPDE